MYILISISNNGFRSNICVSKTKRLLITYLKKQGYYWSKKHNVYDHKFEKSSYIIQHIEEIKTI